MSAPIPLTSSDKLGATPLVHHPRMGPWLPRTLAVSILLVALGVALPPPARTGRVDERARAKADIALHVSAVRKFWAQPMRKTAAVLCGLSSAAALKEDGGKAGCIASTLRASRGVTAAQRAAVATLRVTRIRVRIAQGHWHATAVTNLKSGSKPWVIEFVDERGHFRYESDS
jgi:hypothetical protein